MLHNSYLFEKLSNEGVYDLIMMKHLHLTSIFIDK